MIIANLEELIGKECTYNVDESNTWDDNNTIKCKVIGFNYELEDKFPYTLSIGVELLPINMENIDKYDLYDMQCGVSLDSVIFI